MPGVGRGIKKKKKTRFFSLCNPRGTQEFPQKSSAHLVQLFGHL